MLDELLIGGEIQETSKKNVLKAIAAQDLLQEEDTPQVIVYVLDCQKGIGAPRSPSIFFSINVMRFY